MSWVFLLDKLVFKLKKPARFPFLDFTTLESREFYCREEVRLNARLAPGVYLGVVALLWHEGFFFWCRRVSPPGSGEATASVLLPTSSMTLRSGDEHQELAPLVVRALVRLAIQAVKHAGVAVTRIQQRT